jgi:L-aspartate oxidase
MTAYSDVLIIGSGVSGLSFALKVARFSRVTLITKKKKADSATNLAQGGVAAVLSVEDSVEAHVADTLVSGDGLCNEDIVRIVTTEGPARVRELVDFGVRFQKGLHGEEFDLGMEGGHSTRRVAHASDLTGKEIERALLAQIALDPNIEVLENHLAIDLLIESKARGRERQEGDRCLGAYVLNRITGEVETRLAGVTVLCTGGCGKVYLYTTNPDIATGDGVAMAYRAGARVANLEFIQFHPTCFFNREAKNFLISEAVRGEGAILRDLSGEAFMAQYDPLKELAPRDMVARAIDDVLKRTGDDHVLLDITHRSPAFIQEHFPNIYATCLGFGIDMTRTPIPVVPGAHYACGGLVTDLDGHTTIPGLYAVGEVACTGLHGANRLASNSLLEGLVFSQRAARASAELPALSLDDVQDWEVGDAVPSDESVVVSQDWDELRRFMWNFVGIVRSDKRLQRARRRLDLLREEIKEYYWQYVVTPDLIELRNIATVAHLIIECAMRRKESRGLHYTADYPNESADFVRDTVVARYGQP